MEINISTAVAPPNWKSIVEVDIYNHEFHFSEARVPTNILLVAVFAELVVTPGYIPIVL